MGVLGPLALRVAGAEVRVPGTRRRALLATLALARGRVVGVDRLVDTLWPDDPPEDAAQALYNHVSRLRRDLGAAGGRLARQGAGYVLELDEDELDVTVARAVVDGLPHLPPARVLGRALEASELWRGPALEEFRGHSDLDVEAVALDELRMRLNDEVVQARIAVGDGSAVADASAAVAADPLRERGVLLLMQALAREGRTAEAMAAGTAYRRRLAAETGLDPGPALGRLEQEIASGELAARDRPPAWSARRTVARPSGPLVGRQQDQDEVLRLLAGHRVVTLTGPGGVGKTRLALEVTAALAELDQVDAVVVDLAAVEDASRVVQAVVSTLGLRLVAAEPPTALDIAAALADATMLLVLDNAEHVAEACRDLVDAVDRQAPGVRVLVTSRVTLHARSEYVVRLQPLPTPRDAQDLAALERQPSVRAFLEHARRRDRSYAADRARRRTARRDPAAPRRTAPRDRAGRRAGRDAAARRGPRPARADPGPGHGRGRARGGPAADPATDDPLVLRPADLGPADPAPRRRRVPRRRRPGHRGGARRRGGARARPGAAAARPGRRVAAGRGSRSRPATGCCSPSAPSCSRRSRRWESWRPPRTGSCGGPSGPRRRSGPGCSLLPRPRPTGGCGPSSTTCARRGTWLAPAG